MATLTVFEYDTPSGAERAIAELGPLQEQRLIRILDAAVVRWENGTKKPRPASSPMSLAPRGDAGRFLGPAVRSDLLGAAARRGGGRRPGSPDGLDDGLRHRR